MSFCVGQRVRRLGHTWKDLQERVPAERVSLDQMSARKTKDKENDAPDKRPAGRPAVKVGRPCDAVFGHACGPGFVELNVVLILCI